MTKSCCRCITNPTIVKCWVPPFDKPTPIPSPPSPPPPPTESGEEEYFWKYWSKYY